MDLAIKDKKQRLDYQGQELVASYDQWIPYCFINSTSGDIYGIAIDAFEVVLRVLFWM